MTSFVQALILRAPGADTPPPPIRIRGAANDHSIAIILPATDDAEISVSLQDGPPRQRYILEPYFWMIEYEDGKGDLSRRRVTMRHIEEDRGKLYLGAICHERHAYRSFRIDRIRCLIDQDGAVADPGPIFEELMAVSDTELRTPRPNPLQSMRPHTKLRKALEPALTLLCASARSDDYLHPAELERILLFIEGEASHMVRDATLKSMPDDHGFRVIETLVRETRPTKDDIAAAFNSVCNWEAHRLTRLFRALAATASADGRVDDVESALARDLDAIGTHRHGFGWRD